MIPSCPRCESKRVGIYYLSKHGILSGFGTTLLLGLRRCVDCGAEFSIRTGADAGVYARRLRWATFGAVALMIVVGVAYTLAT